MEIRCLNVSNEPCQKRFIIDSADPDASIVYYLDHYNTTHDPEFVARCKDDLIVEYQWIIQKLRELLLKDNFKFQCYQEDAL